MALPGYLHISHHLAEPNITQFRQPSPFPMGNTGQGSVVGTRKVQGEGGPGGLPVSGHWGGGEDAYLPPLAWEARASETKGGCVPDHRGCSTPKDKYLSPSQRGESPPPE